MCTFRLIPKDVLPKFQTYQDIYKKTTSGSGSVTIEIHCDIWESIPPHSQASQYIPMEAAPLGVGYPQQIVTVNVLELKLSSNKSISNFNSAGHRCYNANEK